jgi:MinD superfamily P-loop ATPase
MEKDLTEIVILSGKGGTGKTSVTAAFAAIAKDPVIADCDVDAADLHLILQPEIYHEESYSSGAKAVINPDQCTGCGICIDLCRFNAVELINGHYVIDEYACEGCGLCVIACPENAIRSEIYENNNLYLSNCRFGPFIYGEVGIAEENSGRLVARIREEARKKAREAHANVILVDGPPGIGCPAISSVTGSDMVVAVTEPTKSGWHDLQRLIEMIGKFNTKIFVILNKYDLNEPMSEKIGEGLIEKNIPVIGKLPYDEQVIHALIDGKSIPEYMKDHFLTHELQRIWDKLLKINVLCD